MAFLADSPQAERVSEAKRLAGKRTRRRYRVTDLSAELLDLSVNESLGEGGRRDALHIRGADVSCCHNL